MIQKRRDRIGVSMLVGGDEDFLLVREGAEELTGFQSPSRPARSGGGKCAGGLRAGFDECGHGIDA
jgi:hypothetical protein